MAGGVYGWAEDKSVSGSHNVVPVTYSQYIEALEDALRELAYIWPEDGRIMGKRDVGRERPDNSWVNRVRKNLGLKFYEGGVVPEPMVPGDTDVACVSPGAMAGEGTPMELIVSNVGNCERGHALWSLNEGPPEHIIPSSSLKTGEYLAILECQEELEQKQGLGRG